jgi:peroxiredoxin
MRLPKAGGGEVMIGGAGAWQILILYRGMHCPLCRVYLKSLAEMLLKLEAEQIGIVVASGDPVEKAESEMAEEGWTFPVAYGMSIDQMKTLGLYISSPRSEQETDRPFPEPGLFVTNPNGHLQIVDISNAPFARPDLLGILRGIRLIKERNYPIRGTYA